MLLFLNFSDFKLHPNKKLRLLFYHFYLNNLTHEKKFTKQNFVFAGMPSLHVVECNGTISNHHR